MAHRPQIIAQLRRAAGGAPPYQSLIEGECQRERERESERGRKEEAAFDDQSVGPPTLGVARPVDAAPSTDGSAALSPFAGVCSPVALGLCGRSCDMRRLLRVFCRSMIELRSKKSEVRSQKSEVRSKKHEKSEVGSRKQKVGSRSYAPDHPAHFHPHLVSRPAGRARVVVALVILTSAIDAPHRGERGRALGCLPPPQYVAHPSDRIGRPCLVLDANHLGRGGC